ncbi:PAS domain S-box protein [Propionivibrio dicarboxylicus]|uniref:PAS domain S-box-containing protein n=1 Tax=Propionivibrio dicarboxylicus TaxID=83767 RepID=A0A1G7ZHR5_9RHOO|nr:cache domain-containing protein [Propionivibrio dicarboxylicus]SDH08117.1 PAS domain S-box-containing protein [Propionivibrio dicarboxylicus]
MNRFERMLQQHWHIAWGLVLLGAAVIGVAAGQMARMAKENDRLELLQGTARNASREITEYIMNGQLVASIGATGILEIGLWHEGKDNGLLNKIGKALNADGVFVFNRGGIVDAAWNMNGKQSVGMNVSDRPYYHEAMGNRSSVHVAVSPFAGERSLYFSTPLRGSSGNPISALVVRTDIDRLQNLLAKQTDIALFVSPDGIVFASSREDWIGRLTVALPRSGVFDLQMNSPIGALIEPSNTEALPLPNWNQITTFAGVRYAVANASVYWNDNREKWRLILAEDLSRSLPLSHEWRPILSAAFATFLTGAIILILLRRKHDRDTATQEMQAILARQEAQAINKTHLSQASLHFQQTGSAEELGQAYLDTTHVLLNVLQGAVYRITGEKLDTLQLLASFGCTRDIPASFAVGEGLLGQCALEKKKLIIDGVKPEYWKITSVLSETLPREIVLIPVMRHERLLGIVEIAQLLPLDSRANEMLDELTMLLSLNLEIHLRNAKTQQLLDETQSQSRELEAQATRIEQTALRLAAHEETEKNIRAWHDKIMASIPDGIAITSDDGIIIEANTALETLFGYAPGEMKGEQLRRLLGYWQSAAVFGQRAIMSGSHKNGSVMPVSVTLTELPATDSQGSCRCALIRAEAPRSSVAIPQRPDLIEAANAIGAETPECLATPA